MKKHILLSSIFLVWVSVTVSDADTKALRFGGSQDYVEIPHDDSISPTQQISVELWGFPAGRIDTPGGTKIYDLTGHRVSSTQGLIFKKNDGPGNSTSCFESYLISIASDGKASWTLGKPNTSNARVQSERLALSRWVHLAGTYNGQELRFYVNGSLVETKPWPYGIEGSSNPLTLGRIYGGRTGHTRNFFIGRMAEVRIWNRALSQEEIRATMNRQLTGSELGLVAYYRFEKLENLGVANDGRADDVRDLSGNGNHGDLVGKPRIVESDLRLLPQYIVYMQDEVRRIPQADERSTIGTYRENFTKGIRLSGRGEYENAIQYLRLASLWASREDVRVVHDYTNNNYISWLDRAYNTSEERQRVLKQQQAWEQLIQGYESYLSKDYNSAVEKLEQSIESDKDLVEAYKWLGCAAVEADEVPKARMAFRELIQRQPDLNLTGKVLEEARVFFDQLKSELSTYVSPSEKR